MSVLKNALLYNYKATILNIVDGDTIDVKIDLGFKIYIDMRLRLAGLDTPERNTESGKAAKLWLETALPINHEVRLSIFKAADKYGRYLATIHYNGVDINQELIKSGHASEYFGGKKGS